MTVLLMDIGHMIGSFIPLIFFCVLAILMADKVNAWWSYSIGAVIQLLALIGEQYAYTEAGMGQPATLDCIITVVILAVTALIIKRRKKYLQNKANQSKSE